MTRDEHYREAERLLDAIRDLLPGSFDEMAPIMVARAQVHATLATVYVGVERQAVGHA